MFQKNGMIPLPTHFPGLKSYLYKTYTVCASVNSPRTATERPMKVVSICGHAGKKGIPEEELNGILEFCGMNLNKPIHRETLKYVGDPTFGDSQYYIQPVNEPIN